MRRDNKRFNRSYRPNGQGPGVGSEFGRTGGEIAFTIDDDRCAFNPLRAMFGNPVPCSPLANVVAAREDPGALDVADLDDVFVFGEHVAELLTGCTMTHGAVDVFQNLSGITRSVA